MTHKELDDLFRANSERGEFAPEPGEWEAMTALLDEDERRDRYAWWVSVGWFSLFVLLIAGGLYGLYINQSVSKRDTPTSKTSIPIASVEEGNGVNENSVDFSSSEALVIEEISGDAGVVSNEALVSNQANPQLKKSSATSLATSKLPVASRLIETNEVVSSSNSTSINQVVSSPKDNQQAPKIGVDLMASAAATVVSKSQDLIEKEVASTIANEPLLSPLDRNELEAIALKRPELEQLDLDELVLPPSPRVLSTQSTWSKFGVGLFAAQELTSVAMSNHMRMGSRFGAQFHYKPFKQWSLELGVSYAHKSYMAPDAEMQNTLGLFIDDVLPSQTDGECDMIEVPLTLSFLPNGHGQAGPFVSGGVVSYRIFKEEMVFHYNEPTIQVGEATVPDAVNAIFGSAHLQVGYRFVPKRGPSWRVGPYLQVPMTMVGSGKLPIYSGGLQLEVELF